MIYKLHTSKSTQRIFTDIGNTYSIQPFALSKIAIALSINQGPLSEGDFQTDAEGLELNRQTIFGENEILFNCLIIASEGRYISEDLFFPKFVKAHLDRGSKLLESEFKYNRNLYVGLCNIDANL